ncbi:MAG: LruC domain-containing protein [Deltaproteobacteria bacterium]|nr:LruC domain-containing protein [Deltaproteobacteria bacterium]
MTRTLCLAALLALAGTAAQATPSATLNIGATRASDNSAIGPEGILTGDSFYLTVQYEISGLDQPAHLELDLCNDADWLVSLMSGGSVVYDDGTHCPANPWNGWGRSYVAKSDTIAPPSNSTQSVTGVFTLMTFSTQYLIPDGAVWHLPVSLVLEGPPATTLQTQAADVTLHSTPRPDLSVRALNLSIANGPDGVTPGFAVQYALWPQENPQNLHGDHFIPGTTELIDPIPAGAALLDYQLGPFLDATHAQMVAGNLNSNPRFTTDTDGAGHVTALHYFIDNVEQVDTDYDNGAVVTLWFPLNPSGLTTMSNTVAMQSPDGSGTSRTATNVMGTTGAQVRKEPRQGANDPSFGANPGAYSPPGAPIQWSISVTTYDDGSGASGSQLIAPVIIDTLPEHARLDAISNLQRGDDGRDLKPLSVLSIDPTPGCGPASPESEWTQVPIDATGAVLASARCIRVAVNALASRFQLSYVTYLDEPFLSALQAAPGAYEFQDNYANLSASNITQGWGETYGPQTGGSVTAFARWTYWNTGFPEGLMSDGSGAVNEPTAIDGRVPLGYTVHSVTGYQNLTFASTLPLELDLDGPPVPSPYSWIHAFAVDDNGNDWQPTCAWSPQIRSGATVTPAWFRCVFPGHFPGTAEDPYTAPGCTPPADYTSCFDRPNYTDANGHQVFNNYNFHVPLHAVAGAQGESIHGQVQVWADNAPAVAALEISGSSEQSPFVAPFSVNVSGHLEMVLQKSAPATSIVEGGSLTYTLRFSNTGTVGTQNTRIYDLFGRDARTGAALPGCEQPRLVSVATVSPGAPAFVEYTTDASPTSASAWGPAPSDLSTVTGLRISPQSAFDTQPGTYSPGDVPLEVQVVLADTAGAGAKMCNTASLTADGFAPTLSAAGEVDVMPSCQDHVYGPGLNEHGLVFFEDLWPVAGDLDFNDQTISYNYDAALDQTGKVTELLATFNPLSLGAQLHSGLYLHLPLPADTAASIVLTDDTGYTRTLTPMAGEHELVLELAADTRALFGQAGYLNTVATAPVVNGHAFNVHVTFAQATALDTSLMPYDLFIARSDDFGHQLHLSQYAGTDRMNAGLFGGADDRSTQAAHFIDERGLPFAMTVPESVHWMQERAEISTGYPDIIGFASSGGATNANWYETNVNAAQLFTHGASGALPPMPRFVGAGLTGACPPAQSR